MPAKQNKHTPISFTSKPAPAEPSKPLTAHEKALQVHTTLHKLSAALPCRTWPSHIMPISGNINAYHRRAAE